MAVFPRGIVASVDRGMCGLGVEPRKFANRSADVVPLDGRQHRARRYRKALTGSAWSKAPCTHRNTLRGTREIPSLATPSRCGPRGQQESTTAMNDGGKSDKPIVPKKGANKGDEQLPPAERLEGRGLAKGKSAKQTRSRTQGRADLQQALDRIRKAAKEDQGLRFNNLWHHICDTARLRQAFYALKRNATPGVDGETWRHYQENLEANLEDLHERLKRGAYRARPVQRVYIPKADGRQRPIGITALEDKIVQKAVTEVLAAVYEQDFLGFSYGFRPGRGPHDALDAVTVAIEQHKVSWVLDADIRGFFDAMDHDWVIRFVEHRIVDKRVLRHIKKWLNAGVLEDGTWHAVEEGVPQGGSICPQLANIYLHYVFDLWAHQWRNRHARGEVYIVRYADDFIVCFQYKQDAEQFHGALQERLQDFNLELSEKKTRLINFGRFAAQNCAERGEGKPETFDFLGFTHICSTTRHGAFCVRRKTMAKKKRAKLAELAKELRRRMHRSIAENGRWLRSVLEGHYRYYGVPRNYRSLAAFRYHLLQMWRRTLRRRSDKKKKVTWTWMEELGNRWLPKPRILQPYPNVRFDVRTQGRSPVR
jgi:RNA-directed DNA polymerase